MCTEGEEWEGHLTVVRQDELLALAGVFVTKREHETPVRELHKRGRLLSVASHQARRTPSYASAVGRNGLSEEGK